MEYLGSFQNPVKIDLFGRLRNCMKASSPFPWIVYISKAHVECMLVHQGFPMACRNVDNTLPGLSLKLPILQMFHSWPSNASLFFILLKALDSH